jgi:hypothetical protein
VNRIVEVKLTLQEDDSWIVAVTKEFAPEYGGGTQTFSERGGYVHHALDIARGMVTVSPGRRTDL